MSEGYHVTPTTKRELEFVKQARRYGKELKMPKHILDEYIDETLHGFSDDEIVLGEELKRDIKLYQETSTSA